MKMPIYLDHNATTPPADEVVEAMRRTLRDGWGNAGSPHAYGVRAKQALTYAREQVAELIGAQPGEVVFTSGGTESNQLAIFGSIGAQESVHPDPEHQLSLYTSAIEHPAVAGPVGHLQENLPGLQVLHLPCDAQGRVTTDRLREMLSGKAPPKGRGLCGLVSVIHAHNETGVIQPIRELADEAHQHGLIIHTDAAQSVGKIPVQVDALFVDMLSIAGHKLYGPQGTGALYVRNGTPLMPLMFGGGQEHGLRPGTENIPSIVGLGVACELAVARLHSTGTCIQQMRDRLESILRHRIEGLVVHGEAAERLPNTSYIGIAGVSAQTVLSRLKGVAIATGSACHSDGSIASAALRAMGVSAELAAGTLRLSLGRSTTDEQVDVAAAEISAAIEAEQV